MQALLPDERVPAPAVQVSMEDCIDVARTGFSGPLALDPTRRPRRCRYRYRDNRE